MRQKREKRTAQRLTISEDEGEISASLRGHGIKVSTKTQKAFYSLCFT
jgi:hypothetical protein